MQLTRNFTDTAPRHWPWWSGDKRRAEPRPLSDRLLLGIAIAGLGEPIVDLSYADALVRMFDEYLQEE